MERKGSLVSVGSQDAGNALFYSLVLPAASKPTIKIPAVAQCENHSSFWPLPLSEPGTHASPSCRKGCSEDVTQRDPL